MTLKELIDLLDSYDPEITVREGFNNPHSYRGFYECLAFEPARNVTIRHMADAARSALGQTFFGYKGGDFTMHAYTKTYLAHYGDTGDELSRRLVAYMLQDEVI